MKLGSRCHDRNHPERTGTFAAYTGPGHCQALIISGLRRWQIPRARLMRGPGTYRVWRPGNPALQKV